MLLKNLSLKRRVLGGLEHLIVEGPDELVFAMEKAFEMLKSPKIESAPLKDHGIRNVGLLTADKKIVVFVSNERKIHAAIKYKK